LGFWERQLFRSGISELQIFFTNRCAPPPIAKAVFSAHNP